MAHDSRIAHELAWKLLNEHDKEIRKMLRRNCNKAVAIYIDDYMQDLYKGLVVLYAGQKMQGVKNERTYLFRLAKNNWIGYQQQIAKKAKKEKAYAQEMEQWEEMDLFGEEESRQIHALIACIGPERRKNILLEYASGKSMKEIALEMKLNVAIIKRQLQLARGTIKKNMK